MCPGSFIGPGTLWARRMNIGRVLVKSWGVTAFLSHTFGGVAEWLKAAVLKTAEGESLPGVRIPPPPPKKMRKGGRVV